LFFTQYQVFWLRLLKLVSVTFGNPDAIALIPYYRHRWNRKRSGIFVAIARFNPGLFTAAVWFYGTSAAA